jgi:two-component system OmpR family response regulator
MTMKDMRADGPDLHRSLSQIVRRTIGAALTAVKRLQLRRRGRPAVLLPYAVIRPGVSRQPPVSSSVHIAILDDEPAITLLLAGYLQSHGYRVSQLHDGAALLQVMRNDPPQLVLLDLGLPGEDGFSIARQLRERWQCGLVIVTGRGDSVDKVVGLEVGADDYVTKPFDLRELLARIKAVLRRTSGGQATAGAAPGRLVHRFAGWQLDTAARRLLDPSGKEVALTSGEFGLLTALVERAGSVLSRDILLEQTRGREAGPFDRTIDVQIGRLRKKLEVNVDDPQIIKSVRGAGYILVAPVTSV